MTCYYLDASAWVKRYCREAGSAQVQALFVPDHTLASATLGEVEVAATLARKHRAGESDAPTFTAQAAALGQDWRRFVRVQLTASVMGVARDTALRAALRGADAVHLASVTTLRVRLQALGAQLVLVAADGELLAAADAMGIVTWDPTVSSTPPP